MIQATRLIVLLTLFFTACTDEETPQAQGPLAARISEPIAERLWSARPTERLGLQLSANRKAQPPPGHTERSQERPRREPGAESGRER
jgi:hypothetical protein